VVVVVGFEELAACTNTNLSDNVSQVPGVVLRRLKDTPYIPSLFFLTAARVYH
jgi:hypothetical protein